MKPIIPPKYNLGIEIKNCPIQLLHALEPWCTTVYVENTDNVIDYYIQTEQSNTAFNLRQKINSRDSSKKSEILVRIQGNKFTNLDYQYIQQLSEIIESQAEIGTFELGNLKIEINNLNQYQNNLIVCSQSE